MSGCKSKVNAKVYLLGSESSPLFAMEHLIKPPDGLKVSEVDKAVSLVGSALCITWQIQKIIIVAKLLINLVRQVLDCVFVWDVFDHQSRSRVLTETFRTNNELSRWEQIGRHRLKTV